MDRLYGWGIAAAKTFGLKLFAVVSLVNEKLGKSQYVRVIWLPIMLSG